jgi:hypothetical protein
MANIYNKPNQRQPKLDVLIGITPIPKGLVENINIGDNEKKNFSNS